VLVLVLVLVKGSGSSTSTITAWRARYVVASAPPTGVRAAGGSRDISL